jgi:hypothetical protein
MEFIVNNLDLIFVPAGVALFLLVWITGMVRAIWKIKKGLATEELQWDDSNIFFDTWDSSSSMSSYSSSNIHTSDRYRHTPGNVYNWDS